MLAELLNFQGAKPCLGVGSFSKLFDIKKTQYELDFVDIDPEADMPLFLDPYYISKCEFPFAENAYESICSYFAYTLIKMGVSVIPCTGSIIFNTSFRSIIILIKYRCLSLHRMYVGIPIAQIWQNPE